ncbi:hypothetical protein HDU77_002138 [Chytriomyces hyalinus]|nr:hypothetical protein HDU77_002138 [Chytriomyces hyalinus]
MFPQPDYLASSYSSSTNGAAKKSRPKIQLPRVFRPWHASEQMNDMRHFSPHSLASMMFPVPIAIYPFHAPNGFSPGGLHMNPMNQAPKSIPSDVQMHNQWLPSDDPKERARQEWEEERQRLRISDKRESISKKLAEEEAQVNKDRDELESRLARRSDNSNQKREKESKAAITIQKVARGYLTRKKFVAPFVNDYALVKSTDLYLCEKYIHEVMTEEFIPDLIVEICETQYFPITTTISFISHKLKYHMIGIVCGELISEFLIPWLEELLLSRSYGTASMAPLSPECDSSGGFICDFVGDEIQAIVQESIEESIDEMILSAKSEEAFDIIFTDALESMELIDDCLFDALCAYIFWDFLMDEEIENGVKRAAWQYEDEHQLHNVTIQTNPRSQSQSVSHVLDYILDLTIMGHLTNHLASGGASFLEWDTGDRLIDAILVDVLMSRYLSLRGTELATDEKPEKIVNKK